MAYDLRKEDLIHEPCFIEAKNVTNTILKLIRLEIDRSKGVPVDDEIEYESDSLIYNNLKLKKCILKSVTPKRISKSISLKG